MIFALLNKKKNFLVMFHILMTFVFIVFLTGDFRKEQLKHSRVKEAYTQKEAYLRKLVKSKKLEFNQLEIYLRAFKHEGTLEVWAKNKTAQKFQLLISYNVCQSSGTLGPKRKEGDLQVPEGFYNIDQFNPESNYYLSLGINYPNKADKVFADKSHPGGNIFIHGNCVTIGCLPITDDKIKELYLLALEARNNGQFPIPVSIFPMKMTSENMKILQDKNYDPDTKNLWQDLQSGYEIFEKQKTLLVIEYLPNGRHKIH